MKKKYLLCCLIVIISTPLFSQDQNLLKYWNYRNRFNSSFIIKGTSQGCDGPGGYNLPFDVVSPKENKYRVQQSDATIDLAWYISVLATEYSLLKQSDQSTDEVLKDLRDAMLTYERLDLKAERFLNPAADCSYDGFFIRDDGDHEFFRSNFNKIFPEFFIGHFTTANYHSDWTSADKRNNEMSKDQMAHLIMGFALVKKCLAGVSYSGYNFSEKAVEYTTNMMRAVSKFGSWKIYNPAGEEVKRGSDFESMEAGWAAAATYVTGISYSYTPISHIAWQKLKAPLRLNGYDGNFIDLIDHDFVRCQIMMMAAVGNSWGDGTDDTANAIARIGSSNNLSVFSLVHAFLWNSAVPDIDTRWGTRYHNDIKDILDSAPCDGPEFRSSIRIMEDPRWAGTPGWRAYSRWSRPEDATNGGGSTGLFSGMDYMLFHNLYALTLQHSGSYYGNLSSLQDAKPFPMVGRGFNYGTMTNPALIPSINSIASTSKITSVTTSTRGTTNTFTGNVTYRAGKEIVLKPGFQVSDGAHFRAHIQSYAESACVPPPPPPLVVTIQGQPYSPRLYDNVTLTAYPRHGKGSTYLYKWYWRTDSNHEWTEGSLSQTYSIDVLQSVYEIKVEVTSGNEAAVAYYTIACMNCSCIDCLPDKDRVQVYPNPSKNYFEINVSSTTEGKVPKNSGGAIAQARMESLPVQVNQIEYTLYDSFGQVVLHEKSEDITTRVNTSSLKEGIYHLNIGVNGSVTHKKIVIKR